MTAGISWRLEPSTFRLFRCERGCFHLEWKYFGIVHMTGEHLLRLYAQLVHLCEKRKNELCLCLECNDDIQIRLTHHEALVLMAQVGAFLQVQNGLSGNVEVGYVM